MSTYRKGERVQGMTIERAKNIAREKLGRLPRMGYECLVLEYDENRREPYAGFAAVHVRVWLVNTSGRLSLKETPSRVTVL